MRTMASLVAALAGVLLLLPTLASCSSTSDAVVDVAPVFYPPPPAEPRLQYLGSLSRSTDVEERSDFATLVVGRQDDHTIDRPHGTAWWNDRLYVCDPGAGALVVFDFSSQEMRRLVADQPGVLQKPLILAIAPDGWKYVVDARRKVVVVLDAEDQFRSTFGNPDEWRPVGIAADADHLYVTDISEHRIVVLDRSSGTEVRTIGGKGDAPGRFFYPVGVLMAPDGDLRVTDSFNCRVQRLSLDGSQAGEPLGSAGDRPGNFTRPKSVGVDRDGRTYVVDAGFENIQLFDADSRLLLFFGAPGAAPGSMNLPAHVTLSYDAVPHFSDRVAPGFAIEYVLFVSNQLGTERVNVYGLLRPR